MDDWITRVYDERMVHGPFRVEHMIGHQGTRYSVDYSHQAAMTTELEAGRRRILEWICEHTQSSCTQPGQAGHKQSARWNSMLEAT